MIAERMNSIEWPEQLSNLDFPHFVGKIKIVTTHISWVIVAGRYCYKIKRPVDLEFVDYSTLDRRHHFCEEEVRLNRRLSPDVYLGVVPIARNGNRFRVEGGGQVVEYAVKMRRLPEDRM